jgi:hypothetical protein
MNIYPDSKQSSSLIVERLLIVIPPIFDLYFSNFAFPLKQSK